MEGDKEAKRMDLLLTKYPDHSQSTDIFDQGSDINIRDKQIVRIRKTGSDYLSHFSETQACIKSASHLEVETG